MKVAVVGATGLVGTVMLRLLEERGFPVSQLLPVASEKSVGKEIVFKNAIVKVVSMQHAIDEKPAIALFSAGGETSLAFAEQFAAKIYAENDTLDPQDAGNTHHGGPFASVDLGNSGVAFLNLSEDDTAKS